MTELKFNGNQLEVYDALDELPIHRFMEYNRYLMVDSGCGGTMGDVGSHVATVKKYAAQKDYSNMEKELDNYHQSLAFMAQKVNPKMNSFVALLKSINGNQVLNVGDDAAKRIIQELGKKGLTWGKLKHKLESVKKKLMVNLTYTSLMSMIRPKPKNISAN